VVLGALGSRRSPRTGQFTAPHGDTFRRVLRVVDADAVDTMIGALLAERVGVGSPPAPDDDPPDHDTTDPGQDQDPSGHGDNPPEDPQGDPPEKPIVGALGVEGKAVRGACRDDDRAVHLLAAAVHGVPAVLAQRDVAHKTNEITQVKPLLAPLNLTGWAVTLDALHCQRETAPLPGGGQERGIGVHRGQGQPAQATRRAQRAALDDAPDHPHHPRPRPWT
jgi:hypothetical protein